MSDVTAGLGEGVKIAEAQRDKRKHDGFMADLFRGTADFSVFSLLNCGCEKCIAMTHKANILINKLKQYLPSNLDPEEVDETNEIPKEHYKWLCENGYYGLKIPEEYGGQGLNQAAYMRTIASIASYCSGTITGISASNTIGVGFPLKHYGTEEQKKEFLPLVAKAPTGFAFTEKEAGSDPASMETVAVRIKDKALRVQGYELTGTKVWTTCGPISDTEFLAPLLCVVAKIVDYPEEIKDKNYKSCFGVFIVPTNAEGLKIVQRCYFEGLNGIPNGVESMDRVYVPYKNLIGEDNKKLQKKFEWHPREGGGFKIAIEALNTGRITVAGACSAVCRQALLMAKSWCNMRHQWDKNIGQHENIGSGILVPALANTFAMEAMAKFAAARTDHGLDSRLEATTAKVFASERGDKLLSDIQQTFGGRGYEKAKSLAKRGEPAFPIERFVRGFRPNRIFEGSTEILSLWVMREGSDEYKKRADRLSKGAITQKCGAFMAFGWDVGRFSMPGSNGVPSNIHPSLSHHLYYVSRRAKRFAKTLILLSKKHKKELKYKQLMLTRFFWIVTELYAMTASCFYAEKLAKQYDNRGYLMVADYYCREAIARIDGNGGHFGSLKNNNDKLAKEVATTFLEGKFDNWLREDIIPMTDILGLE